MQFAFFINYVFGASQVSVYRAFSSFSAALWVNHGLLKGWLGSDSLLSPCCLAGAQRTNVFAESLGREVRKLEEPVGI